MSIISGIQAFIKTYTGLSNIGVWIDKVGPDIEVGIIPIPGSRVVEENIDGSSTREYPFALQTCALTADDAARLDNSEFFEEFSDWLESQTLAGTFPTLGSKQTATKIETTSSGALYEQGDSGIAIYQIICKLTYEQQP